MTRMSLLAALVLVALAAPAFAGPVAERKDDLGPFAVWPAAILLLAFPLATAVRAFHRAPVRIAEAAEGPGHAARILGLANLVLLLMVGSAAKGHRVLGIVAALLLLAFAILAFLGLSAVAVRLGRRLFRREERGDGVGAFALAWLILSGLSLVPVLGLLYLLWWLTWGVGETLFATFGPRRSAAEGPRTPEA